MADSSCLAFSLWYWELNFGPHVLDECYTTSP